MRALDESTAARFLIMVDGLEKIGDRQRVDGGIKSPEWVELIRPMNGGWIYTFTRYRTSEDSKADPSISFLLTSDGKVAPITYRNDYLGIVRAAAEPGKRGGIVVQKEFQAKLCVIAQNWIEQIWTDAISKTN